MSFIYTLRKGDEGQEVKRLQSKLPTVADGKFGSKTEAEVRAYQQHNGLGIDGQGLVDAARASITAHSE